MEFNAFNEEDRPCKQLITLRGKFGANKTIKIEALRGTSCDVLSYWAEKPILFFVAILAKKAPNPSCQTDLDNKLQNALFEFLKARR
ncbi:unnamed protein product [Camellia sinensis]